MNDWLSSILFGNGNMTHIVDQTNMLLLLTALGGGIAIYAVIFFLAMGKSKPNAKPSNNQV